MLGLFIAGGAFADAYKWTDENGIVHYSDRPHPGAKRIELDTSGPARPQATPARVAATTQSAQARTTAAPPRFRYQTVEITAPEAEETLWNIDAQLDVTVSLSPSLQSGHQIRVFFDGNQRIVEGQNFRLEEVYRGAHNLQVEVIDEAGKPLNRSPPMRFYVQQNSVQ